MSNTEGVVTKSQSLTQETQQWGRSAQSWQPRPYQERAVRFLLANSVGALFLDMGLGKTSSTLAAIKILIAKGITQRVLIIAPLRVCYTVWPNEVKKWAEFEHLRVEVLHGSGKEKALRRDADIYLINPEGLAWLNTMDRAKTLNADMLVVDESTRFKHSNTSQFKNLKYLLPTFRRRYILTGTPSPNGIGDLFGQIYILDGGMALGRFITAFRREFFDQSGYMGYEYRPKPGAAEEIYRRIAPMTLRMAAEDYLKMPEKIVDNIVVQLPAAARKAYTEIEVLFVTAISEGQTIVAGSAASAGTKMRQLVNGAIYKSAEERAQAATFNQEWVEIHDEKLSALQEIVDQGRPVLLAYEFEHDAYRIRKKFKDAVFLSDFKGAGLDAIIAKWNAGLIPMLCAHPKSAGHGLNLQGCCDTVVWFGVTWDLELYHQFNARVLRQGNTNKIVFIYHIIAEETIDEAVLKAIAAKDKDQNALLNALKAYAVQHQ